MSCRNSFLEREGNQMVLPGSLEAAESSVNLARAAALYGRRGNLIP